MPFSRRLRCWPNRPRARAPSSTPPALDLRWRRDLLDLIKQSPAIQKLFREKFRDLLDN
ncbi:MAG: hypothetical protein U1E76_21330 [Planctomycetota bacterium]